MLAKGPNFNASVFFDSCKSNENRMLHLISDLPKKPKGSIVASSGVWVRIVRKLSNSNCETITCNKEMCHLSINRPNINRENLDCNSPRFILSTGLWSNVDSRTKGWWSLSVSAIHKTIVRGFNVLDTSFGGTKSSTSCTDKSPTEQWNSRCCTQEFSSITDQQCLPG